MYRQGPAVFIGPGGPGRDDGALLTQRPIAHHIVEARGDDVMGVKEN